MKRSRKGLLFGVAAVLAVCLLGLCACGQGKTETGQTDLTYGRYMDGVRAWVDFSPDQRFEFTYNSVMSAYPAGTFEVKDGKIYATSDQAYFEGVYVFEIIDNETIRFCKGESVEIEVEDGTTYKLEVRE